MLSKRAVKPQRFQYGIQVVWIAQWLTLLESIVGILTLGYYVPSSWSFKWLMWASERYIRKSKGASPKEVASEEKRSDPTNHTGVTPSVKVTGKDEDYI